MLEILTLRKKGFNEIVKKGDIVENERKKYVVIDILKLKQVFDGYLVVSVLCQSHVSGDYSMLKNYEKPFYIDSRYKCGEGRRIPAVGEIFSIATNNNHIVKIIGIVSFEYDICDLIVTFQVQLVVCWTKSEMNEAVKRNQISKFKVIEK